MSKKQIFAIAAAGLALVASSVRAQDFVAQETVSYRDLDISRLEGARALMSRIKAASHRVCGDVPEPMDLAGQNAWRTCIAASTSDAVAQVHSPMLAALYNGRTPAPALNIAQASRGVEGPSH